MLIETFSTYITEATRPPQDDEEKALYAFMEELDSVVAHIKVEDIGINTKIA